MAQIVSLNQQGQVQQAIQCTLIRVRTQAPREVEIQLIQNDYNIVQGWQGQGQVRDDQVNGYNVNLGQPVQRDPVNFHITYNW